MVNNRFNLFDRKNLAQPIDNVDNVYNVEANAQTGNPAKKRKPEKVDKVSFEVRDPLYKLSDVVLNEDVKTEIHLLLSRIRNHKLLYETWGLGKIDPLGKRVAINFYGPPGTGKTMCGEALASQLGVQILEVNYADIESKYVGETGKNIRDAFKTAAEKNALLFFDEADAILGRRMSNVTQAADHAVDVARAVMLKSLDSFEGCVVFATNKFEKYDPAFIRRIMQHVEVPKPDEKTLITLWRHMIVPTIPGRDELNFEELAKESVGLAGGDVKNCVVRACSEAVSDQNVKSPVASESETATPVARNKDKTIPPGERKLTQELCLKAIRNAHETYKAAQGPSVSVSERIVSSEDPELGGNE